MEEIERTEPKPKRFKPAVDFKNFDIVGTLMTEMGLTGENLTRQIFSYLDMTSVSSCMRKKSIKHLAAIYDWRKKYLDFNLDGTIAKIRAPSGIYQKFTIQK